MCIHSLSTLLGIQPTDLCVNQKDEHLKDFRDSGFGMVVSTSAAGLSISELLIEFIQTGAKNRKHPVKVSSIYSIL